MNIVIGMFYLVYLFFSRDATHIIFAKDDTENVYGVPEGTGNGEVLLKVIGVLELYEKLN